MMIDPGPIFNVGDKVRWVKPHDGRLQFLGKKSTIDYIYMGHSGQYLVRIDGRQEGHFSWRFELATLKNIQEMSCDEFSRYLRSL